MIDPNAVPTAHHSPIRVPLHWQDEVKLGLDRDVRLGVLEQVPIGDGAIAWSHVLRKMGRCVVRSTSNPSTHMRPARPTTPNHLFIRLAPSPPTPARPSLMHGMDTIPSPSTLQTNISQPS